MLPWKHNNAFPLSCCWSACRCKAWIVAMEMQHWGPFSLLQSCIILLSAIWTRAGLRVKLPDISSDLKQIWAFWTDFHRSPHICFLNPLAGPALVHAAAEKERCDEANRRFSRLARTRLRVCQDFHYVEANIKIEN